MKVSYVSTAFSPAALSFLRVSLQRAGWTRKQWKAPDRSRISRPFRLKASPSARSPLDTTPPGAQYSYRLIPATPWDKETAGRYQNVQTTQYLLLYPGACRPAVSSLAAQPWDLPLDLVKEEMCVRNFSAIADMTKEINYPNGWGSMPIKATAILHLGMNTCKVFISRFNVWKSTRIYRSRMKMTDISIHLQQEYQQQQTHFGFSYQTNV